MLSLTTERLTPAFRLLSAELSFHAMYVCMSLRVCACVYMHREKVHVSLGGVRNDQKNANSIGKESWWASRDRNLFFKANIPPTLMQSPQIGIFLK